MTLGSILTSRMVSSTEFDIPLYDHQGEVLLPSWSRCDRCSVPQISQYSAASEPFPASIFAKKITSPFIQRSQIILEHQLTNIINQLPCSFKALITVQNVIFIMRMGETYTRNKIRIMKKKQTDRCYILQQHTSELKLPACNRSSRECTSTTSAALAKEKAAESQGLVRFCLLSFNDIRGNAVIWQMEEVFRLIMKEMGQNVSGPI